MRLVGTIEQTINGLGVTKETEGCEEVLVTFLRFGTLEEAGACIGQSPAVIWHMINEGLSVGYQQPDGVLFVDLDDIEALGTPAEPVEAVTGGER